MKEDVEKYLNYKDVEKYLNSEAALTLNSNRLKFYYIKQNSFSEIFFEFNFPNKPSNNYETRKEVKEYLNKNLSCARIKDLDAYLKTIDYDVTESPNQSFNNSGNKGTFIKCTIPADQLVTIIKMAQDYKVKKTYDLYKKIKRRTGLYRDIDMTKAEKAFKDDIGLNFIIRPSSIEATDSSVIFTVSFRQGGKVIHARFNITDGVITEGLTREGERAGKTVDDLIKYIQKLIAEEELGEEKKPLLKKKNEPQLGNFQVDKKNSEKLREKESSVIFPNKKQNKKKNEDTSEEKKPLFQSKPNNEKKPEPDGLQIAIITLHDNLQDEIDGGQNMGFFGWPSNSKIKSGKVEILNRMLGKTKDEIIAILKSLSSEQYKTFFAGRNSRIRREFVAQNIIDNKDGSLKKNKDQKMGDLKRHQEEESDKFYQL